MLTPSCPITIECGMSRKETLINIRRKTVTVILLIFMSVSFLLMPHSMVMGQLGVNIYFASVQGVVGQEINLQGTIDTTNGAYQIWIGDKLVASNNSDGYYVEA